jgi:hypothetical protein
MDGVSVLELGWGKIWHKIAVGKDRGGRSQNIGVGLGIGGGESGKEFGFKDAIGCWGGVEYSLVEGLAKLRVVVVKDDVSICWIDGGDVVLLDNIFWFVVEWDTRD